MNELTNKKEELRMLAEYIDGLADGLGIQGKNPAFIKMKCAADWLGKIAECTCGQGVIGCYGGAKCSSDHK